MEDDVLKQEEIDAETKQDLEEPPLYRVLLHNDNYTTMDFVVSILEDIFHKTPAEATGIMLEVHNKGIGVCGTYQAEIAETKIDAVHARAREAGFPLMASMEPA